MIYFRLFLCSAYAAEADLAPIFLTRYKLSNCSLFTRYDNYVGTSSSLSSPNPGNRSITCTNSSSTIADSHSPDSRIQCQNQRLPLPARPTVKESMSHSDMAEPPCSDTASTLRLQVRPKQNTGQEVLLSDRGRWRSGDSEVQWLWLWLGKMVLFFCG